MKNKLTNCKSCGAEIAKSAKVCPRCGAKVKKTNPIATGIVIILILAAIGGAFGGKNEAKPVDTGKTSQDTVKTTSQPTEAQKTRFGINEQAELRDVAVTLVSVEESRGSQFNRPTDGNVFVLCEFEIVNNSKSEIAVSSIASFAAYCDDYSLNYSLSAILEKGNKSQLDGQVAAGKKMKGIIGYEIPEDWQELEVRFTPNFWSGKEMTFVVNHG